jgi:guanylate kinase
MLDRTGGRSSIQFKQARQFLFMNIEKKYNKLILVTAPSGSGKTSIVKYLMTKFSQLAFSVSATTRQPRNNEKEGTDYYFISENEFKERIHRKEFLEWEMVYEGKYYGTLKSEIERIWALKKVPVLDIDVQGAIHVQQQYPVNTISVFIQAPSAEELRSRLKSRGSETADSLEARVSKSVFEMTFKNYFENVIINEDFETACRDTEKVVSAFLEKK